MIGSESVFRYRLHVRSGGKEVHAAKFDKADRLVPGESIGRRRYEDKFLHVGVGSAGVYGLRSGATNDGDNNHDHPRGDYDDTRNGSGHTGSFRDPGSSGGSD